MKQVKNKKHLVSHLWSNVPPLDGIPPWAVIKCHVSRLWTGPRQRRWSNVHQLNKSKAGGFTLIELMVATGIFTIVSVVAIGAILTINNANRKAQAIRAVVDNLNFSMESMSRKLRVGSSYHCGQLPAGVNVGDLALPGPLNCGSNGSSEMSYLSSGITAGEATDPSLPSTVRAHPRVITYKLDRPSGGGKGRIIGFQNPDGSGTDEKLVLTPPEIDIKDLRFFVRGSEALVGGGSTRPTVTIAIDGVITLDKDKLTTPFNLQTTVTSRLLGN